MPEYLFFEAKITQILDGPVSLGVLAGRARVTRRITGPRRSKERSICSLTQAEGCPWHGKHALESKNEVSPIMTILCRDCFSSLKALGLGIELMLT
jgi:hypothetical protein